MIADEGNHESDGADDGDHSHSGQRNAAQHIHPRTETARSQRDPVLDDDVIKKLAQENPLRYFSRSSHASGRRHRGCAASRAAEDTSRARIESRLRGLHFGSGHSAGAAVFGVLFIGLGIATWVLTGFGRRGHEEFGDDWYSAWNSMPTNGRVIAGTGSVIGVLFLYILFFWFFIILWVIKNIIT